MNNIIKSFKGYAMQGNGRYIFGFLGNVIIEVLYFCGEYEVTVKVARLNGSYITISTKFKTQKDVIAFIKNEIKIREEL